MMIRDVEVAVVGAGIVGLAATDALARRGADVVCLDVGEPGHAQSGGLTRIFRHRHDDERLVGLAVEARQGWREWERRSGRRLLGQEGAVFAGADDADADRLARHGVAHRFVAGGDLPGVLGVARPLASPVLVDELGGALRARRAVEVLLRWTGDLVQRTEVLGVSRSRESDLRVQTGHGTYRAEQVLLCAGAGTPRLAAGAGLQLPVSYALHPRPTFRIRASRPRLACWVDRSGEHGEHVYGSPVGSSGRYAVGLATDDNALPLGDAGQLPAGGDVEQYVQRVAGYVARGMPGLDPEPESVRLCMSTALPPRGDTFSTWRAAGVTAFTGSNLFKFAPVLGELLADAATDGVVADVLTSAPA